jgi:ligand-binding sensor domain-containing protein
VALQSLIYVRRGERFFQVRPQMPNRANNAWGWHQTVLQDHNGEWWIPSSFGLFRYPRVPVEKLSRVRPQAVYTTGDGLKTNDIFRIYEDSHGGIWVSAIGPAGINSLSRWDRARNRFESYPAHDETAATAFAEDRMGSLWIGYWDGSLVRYRGGVSTLYQASEGLAGGGIEALQIDHAGRLWIASSGGVTRVDATVEDRPRFQRFGVEQGLSSNVVFCLEEDRWGRMYLATARGLDRTNGAGEIAPGKVRHYTQADGLGRGDLRDILFDNDGVLWCASKSTISRFLPEPDAHRPPAAVYIRQVRVRGVPRPLSDLGETSIPKLLFAPGENQLQFDFSAMAFAPGKSCATSTGLIPPTAAGANPPRSGR